MENSPAPAPEGVLPSARQALDRVSEHNRASIDRWLEMLGRGEKTEYLFELEMWVKCFDRFFRVKNHPMSEQEARDIVRRDFAEELKIVRNVSLRMSYLCTELMSEEHIRSIVEIFLSATFQDGRHSARVAKVMEIEKSG